MTSGRFQEGKQGRKQTRRGAGLRKCESEGLHFSFRKFGREKGRENRMVAGGHSRTQQRFFQGGEVGVGTCGLLESGIHRISRLASVSSCALVRDEDNVSTCQRSQRLSHKDFHVYRHMVLILSALSWTVYCPTLVREVPSQV